MLSVDERWFGFWRTSEDGDGHLPTLEDAIDPAWKPSDRDRLIDYLAKAPVVIAGGTPEVRCRLCDERLSNSSYRSDGEWLWPTDLDHYVTKHLVALPDALAEHIRLRNYLSPTTLDIDLADLPWP